MAFCALGAISRWLWENEENVWGVIGEVLFHVQEHGDQIVNFNDDVAEDKGEVQNFLIGLAEGESQL